MSIKTLVIDTNTVVSAICFRGSVGYRFLSTVMPDDQYALLISSSTIIELWDVLKRSKFDRFISPNSRLSALHDYIESCTPIVPTETITACRDPKDNQFLELAVAGNADMIISRDNDLLALNPFRGIAIMDAEHFLEQSTCPDLGPL